MLSPAELLLLAEELNGALAGARLQKLHGKSPAIFSLDAWSSSGGRVPLTLALEPAFPRLVISETPGENPLTPPGIVTELRELLLNARIESVTSVTQQRILVLTLQMQVDDAPGRRTVVLELFGRAPRLLVLDAAGVVLCSHAADLSHSPRTAKGAVWVAPRFEHATPPAQDGPFPWLPTPLPRPLSAAIETHAREVVAGKSNTDLRSAIRRAAEKLLRRDEQHLAKLQRAQAHASEAQTIRRTALLLQQQLSALPKGATQVELTDPENPDSPPQVVQINPRAGAAAALQKLFKEAHDREAAWARASASVGLAEAKLETVRALLRLCDDAACDATRLRHAAEALDCAPAAATAAAAPKRKGPPPRLPYRTFISKDGLEILVGRTAADNDVLTFDVARKSDLWLHVADHPGSHVVVRCAEEVPEQTLLDAAALAAHFSRCGPGAKPGVSWTRVKHVRKFTGAKAGQVQLADRRSLRSRSEPDRIARLLQSERKVEQS